MKPLISSFWLFVLLIVSSFSLAQQPTVSPITSGDYLIHFSTFNSSFLTPEVASAYGLVRGADRAIVNIAVTRVQPEDGIYGLPVKVTGVARNLMQQQTQLQFIEIQEQNAIYYIAPFEFDDEEVLHFDIDVILPEQNRPTSVNFSKKLYED